MDSRTIARKAEMVSNLLRARLGVRGAQLSDRLARAGRLLPKRVRHAGERIAQAERAAAHPKLARTIDPLAIDEAAHEIIRYLEKIDPKERRKTMALRWLAGAVANLMLIGLGVMLVMHWQGLP